MRRAIVLAGLLAGCAPKVKAYPVKPGVYNVVVQGKGRNSDQISLMDALYERANKICGGQFEVHPTGADVDSTPVLVNGALVVAKNGTLTATLVCTDQVAVGPP